MIARSQSVSRSTTVETMMAASVAPASGMRSRIPTSSPRAIANSLPTPKSTAAEVHSCDEADQEIAGDVAADRPVDVVAHPLVAHPRTRGDEVEGSPDRPRAFEEHEEREEDDRDHADDGGHHAPDDVEDRQTEAQNATRPLGLDRLADAVDDLVVVLEPAERASSPREVVHEVRDRVDELGHLGKERRDDQESDRGHDQEREDEDDASRVPPSEPSPLERLDRRVERTGEDHRDENPREHVPGEIDEEQAQHDEHRDPQHREDGLRTDRDDTRLGSHHLSLCSRLGGIAWQNRHAERGHLEVCRDPAQRLPDRVLT